MGDFDMDFKEFEAHMQVVLDSFKQNFEFKSHQLSSYEHFLHVYLPNIIEEQFPIVVNCPKSKVLHRVKLDGFYYKPPTMSEGIGFLKKLTPTEAHRRKQTYAFEVYLNLRDEVYSGTAPDFELVGIRQCTDLLLCKIPCMVGSSACNNYRNFEQPLREQGHFIINGYEKVMVSQEHKRPNYPFVHTSKGRFMYVCEIRSLHSDIIRSTSTLTISITAEKAGCVSEILVAVPFLKKPVSLALIFRLFGIHELSEMLQLIQGPEPSEQLKYIAQSILSHDLATYTAHTTKDDLFDLVSHHTAQYEEQQLLLQAKQIAKQQLQQQQGYEEVVAEETQRENEELECKNKKKRIRSAKNVFQNEFLPHCGKNESAFRAKMVFLGLCVRKLLRVTIGELPTDDVDDLANKRCCVVGLQLALLVRQLMRAFKKALNAQIFKHTKPDKWFVNFDDFFKVLKITGNLRYAFATGNWGIQKKMTNQSGVSQVLKTTNVTAKISHLRQVNTPLSREGKLTDPRQLHETHLGTYCSCETPDGKSVGLLHHLCLLSRVRNGYPCKVIIPLLRQVLDILPLEQLSGNNSYKLVLVNGVVIGCAARPTDFIARFKELRQYQTIPIDSSICLTLNGEISISVDAEDLFRPLLKIANLHKLRAIVASHIFFPRYMWNQLLVEGVVEYVNKDEENDLVIAMQLSDITPQHTHLEISASMAIYGASAGVVPLPNHNQSARNVFQSAMGKQAIGLPPLGFRDVMTSKWHMLNYGQKPGVTTEIARYIGYDDDATGLTCVVAIAIYGGYNQDDSIILNQAAVDRGLFHSTCLRTTRESEVRQGVDEERFCENLDECVTTKDHSRRKMGASKVEPHGFVAPGTHVNPNEVIANKTIKYADGKKGNISVPLKHGEKCVASQVSINTVKDDLRNVTFQFTSQRVPEMADKFSSRHGQKGVAGIIMPAEDMIRTRDGVVPDIVINPHAIPSRMTIAHLLESLLGKVAAEKGAFINGTPFRDVDFSDLKSLCKDVQGKEVMFSGKTGEMLRNPVFIGLVYYQRPEHMIRDKIHSRSEGPNQIITRQPAEGRGKKGGFRFGEMEKNSMIEHGANAIVTERLMHSSDKITTVICGTCGFPAEKAAPPGTLTITHAQNYCRFCDSHDNIHEVQMPNASRVLFLEMAALHLAPRLTIE